MCGSETRREMRDRSAHWDGDCATRRANDVSWVQQRPDLSLKLVNRVGVSKDSPILDVGGGASTLVDHLLERGFRDLSVLDSSSSALDRAKMRLENRGAGVEWIVADVTSWKPPRRYGVWHDRAVLHFLVERADQIAYARAMRAAIGPEDWAIIGGFAPGVPIKRNGLNAINLGQLFGEEFELMETHGETHVTPGGGDRVFRYHVFRRKPPVRRRRE